ncbi:unnamed protein product [Vitrella brassicaformis CCMP3155]|uniref:Uncharacterized protein n=1 Tax=Vitrella brassicaformis (strain CCMP3155) TaxID=1169540 RepID=A0A0G4E9M5_VITBC|nr:unnamed protein product [Vitrella brassicaformis CCMP3155]|eukprot:CEL92336.1 unnamed protein product [Vitrella brassicaformis CCMP3155]
MKHKYPRVCGVSVSSHWRFSPHFGEVTARRAQGEGAEDHRMTARQLALLKASGGQKRRPIMDVDTSSSDEEDSAYGKGGRRRKAGKKRQRGDEKGKGDKKGGGRDKMEVSDGDEDIEDVVEVGPADALKALKKMTAKLEAQLKQAKQAEKQAREVYELRKAAQDPESLEQQHRMQEVDRQIRVWSSMVCADANTQISHVDKVATKQMKENTRKLDAIRHKLNEMDQDDTEQTKSQLEDLPEALWMADGVGMGAMLGFVSCLESLASVNSFFHHLTQQAGMHPIVELEDSPKMKIAKKWTAGPLSECVDVRIYHPPTASLVCLLERLSATVECVDLHCPLECATTYKNGRRKPQWELDWSVRRDMEKMTKLDLPRNKKAVVFERVESASVNKVWAKLAEDRLYQMPSLQGLSVVDITMTAPRSWIREAQGGINSLHIICEKGDPSCGNAVSLDQVRDVLNNTESAKSLTSLTGRVEFSDCSGFVNLVGSTSDGAGPLEEIEMAIGTIHDTHDIQNLHRFRTKCLAPDAREDYFGRIEEGELQGGPIVHLPFRGDQKALTDSPSTVEVCCQQAEKVTLYSRAPGDTIKEAPGLDSMVFELVHELTVVHYPGTGLLPSYITDDPTSLFPSVSSTVVREGALPVGVGASGRGAGYVLHALSPYLEKVRYELSVCADPEATCTLLPDGLESVSGEGKELAVQLKYDITCNRWRYNYDLDDQVRTDISIGWEMYGDGESEAVREVMDSGRVSSLEVCIKLHRLSARELRTCCGSFAECVVEAFSAVPTLDSVVLSLEYTYGGRPKSVVGMVRKGAKKRCRVTERTDGTIVLRPSQARQRAKVEGGEGEGEGDGDGYGETEGAAKVGEEE